MLHRSRLRLQSTVLNSSGGAISSAVVASALQRLRGGTGTACPPSLDDICTALNDAGADLRVAEQGMQQLTVMDVSTEDSEAIARGVGLKAVLGVLAHHRHHQPSTSSDSATLLRVREHCCRAIANVCMLSSRPSSGDTPSASDAPPPAVFADLLVDGDAVELVLGVLLEQSAQHNVLDDLDHAIIGRRRSAMALTNLIMFSSNGAQRAVLAGGENTVARFLSSVVSAAKDAARQRSTSRPEGGVDEAAVQVFAGCAAAADSALACLVRFSAMEAPDNAVGVHYRYQLLDAGTLEAVLDAIAFFSHPWRPQLEASQGEGASVASSSRLMQLQAAAAEAAAPVLHKAWEFLRTAASYPPNHPLIFDELVAAGFAAGETARRQSAVWTAPMHVCTYRAIVADATKEVEEGVAARLHISFVDFVTDISATRKDVKTVDNADAAAPQETSAVIPTEAALAVVDVLSDGTLSAYSLGLLSACARFWDSISSSSALSSSVLEEQQRRLHTDVAQRHIALLGNLVEVDAVVASENTFAIVDSFLRSYIVLLAAPEAHNERRSVDLLPVVARSFSLIWNALNVAQGRSAMKVTGISEAVRSIVDSAKTRSAATPTSPDSKRSSDDASLMATKTFELGGKLVEKLDAVLDNPTYVQGKHLQ